MKLYAEIIIKIPVLVKDGTSLAASEKECQRIKKLLKGVIEGIATATKDTKIGNVKAVIH